MDYSVVQMAECLGISKWKLYKLIESGVVPEEFLINACKTRPSKQPRYIIKPGLIVWYSENKYIADKLYCKPRRL